MWKQRLLNTQYGVLLLVVSLRNSDGTVIRVANSEWMFVQIKLPAETWMRIKAGEHVKVSGNGWVPEEGVKPDPSDEMFCWDFWEFNGGIGKPMTVYMKSPHNEYDSEFAYEGPLQVEFIQEFEDT